MSTLHLRNIPLKTLRDYLKWKGLKCYRKKGGHETWGCAGLTRNVTFQSHIDPGPEFIFKNILRILGSDRDEFIKFMKE